MIKRSLGCFAILLLAGCAIAPMSLRPPPQDFTVAGRSDKAACIALRTGLVEGGTTSVYVPGVGSARATTLPMASPGVLNFDSTDQRIFAQALATNLERLKLFREAAVAASLLEIEISPAATAAELQRELARWIAADCSGVEAHPPSEPPEEQAAASRDITVSLAFNRTQYLAGVQGYLLDVELQIDAGREPLRRSYRIDSTEGLSWWKQMTKGAGGRQRAAALLMERLLADIDRWMVVNARMTGSKNSPTTQPNN